MLCLRQTNSQMKKVLKWSGIAFLVITILGIIAIVTDDKKNPDEKTADAKSATPEIVYKVVKEEKTGSSLHLRITLNDRYEKTDLIEILRKSKEQYKWDGELVAWFYIKMISESGAWASTAYLPKCDDCATDKDKDDNPVQYQLIGVTKAKADSLRQLAFDSIPKKKLVATYIEDISQCKTEIYEINGSAKRLLHVRIFEPGKYLLQWLKLSVVNGENRYYFEDETDGEGNYMVYEPGNKIVHFRNKEGKEWQTFLSE